MAAPGEEVPRIIFRGEVDIGKTDSDRQLTTSKIVIMEFPIYKVSYSGVFKSLLDILPQSVLKDTPVLPIMTGGNISHLLALEYALKPLISTLKSTSLKGVYHVDKTSDIPLQDAGLI